MKKKVILGIVLICLIALIPLFALPDAEFGGSDDAGSQVESFFFCIQTGIGVGIIAFIMGRFVERKKWMKQEEGTARDSDR